MGNLADILVFVSHVGYKAELRGDKHRKHIGEHYYVETLTVKRFHARQHKRHHQNGQLYAEVFQGILEIGSPEQTNNMHEVESNQEDGSFVVEEAGKFCFYPRAPLKRGSKGINEPDDDKPKLRHAHQEGRQRESHRHHQQTQEIGLVQIGSYGSLRGHYLPLRMVWYSSLPLVLSKISKARFRSGSSFNEVTIRPF